MIVFLEGILLFAGQDGVVVKVGGIGYEVNVAVSTIEKLPAVGEEVSLQIYPVYRENSQALYGFLTKEEKNCFRLIVDTVSGVGPKAALAIMGNLSLEEFVKAILGNDSMTLSTCPGIGKKTAQRLIVDLKEKIKNIYPKLSVGEDIKVGSSNGLVEDAVAALASLGYASKTAKKAVDKAIDMGTFKSVEEIVKNALQQLKG